MKNIFVGILLVVMALVGIVLGLFSVKSGGGFVALVSFPLGLLGYNFIVGGNK